MPIWGLLVEYSGRLVLRLACRGGVSNDCPSLVLYTVSSYHSSAPVLGSLGKVTQGELMMIVLLCKVWYPAMGLNCPVLYIHSHWCCGGCSF